MWLLSTHKSCLDRDEPHFHDMPRPSLGWNYILNQGFVFDSIIMLFVDFLATFTPIYLNNMVYRNILKICSSSSDILFQWKKCCTSIFHSCENWALLLKRKDRMGDWYLTKNLNYWAQWSCWDIITSVFCWKFYNVGLVKPQTIFNL